MEEQELVRLLGELAERSKEVVPSALAEKIKHELLTHPAHRRRGLDTVSIIIDLRINKLAAAAIIVITAIALLGLFGGHQTSTDGIYKDSKLLFSYLLGGSQPDSSSVHQRIQRLRDYLTEQGKDVVYYGTGFDSEDPNSILIHWKITENKYMVILRDLGTRVVSSDELIRMQADMLKNMDK